MSADRSILSQIQGIIVAANPTLPVKYVGRILEVPSDQKYIELVWLPTNGNYFWGNQNNDTGMFRIILHWPNDDQGAYGPMDYMEQNILPLFPKGTLSDGLQLLMSPNFGGPLALGHETLYPWTIRYQRFNRG